MLEAEILDYSFGGYISNSGFLTGKRSLEKCEDHIQLIPSVS